LVNQFLALGVIFNRRRPKIERFSGLTPEKTIKERVKMKKVLALSALIASIGFTGLPAEAKTAETSNLAANNAGRQVRVQIGQNRNRNRRVQVVTRTRNVRIGGRLYRETYQIRYLPNGRTRIRVISRVPVGSRIYNQGRIYNNGVTRTYNQTRNVYIGGRRYRETYRVTRYADGRTVTRLISRVRIG
jgi:hypothetical protein